MKKFLNDPQDMVREALQGLALAHPRSLRVDLERRIVLRADAPVCARKLAQFMVSRAGQNVVVNAGFGALTR